MTAESQNTDHALPSEFTCARCGLCLPVCPVYRETLIETDSPRARLALIKARGDGNLADTAGFKARIYDCTTCMACAQVCPSGMCPSELILDTRAHMKHSPLDIQKNVLNRVISVPARFRKLSVPLSLYEHSGVRKLLRNPRFNKWFPRQAVLLDSMLPERKGGVISHGKAILFPAEGTAKKRVAYFLGCAENVLFTRVARAAIQVLVKNDCEVIIPEGIACCGMPHLGYGETEQAKKLAQQNIDALLSVDADYIISSCATCGSTLKIYSSLLKDDANYTERAKDFAGKLRDFTEFLVHDLGQELRLRKVQLKTTYHEPCHLGRGQGIKEEPRELLKMTLGDYFAEMEEADSCCGGAGSYALTHGDLSIKILDRKMRNVKDSGAEILVTACPGCQIQLARGIKLHCRNIRLLHITEVLAEACKTE